LRYRSAVVLEDLNGLREDRKGGSKFNKRLTLWFYRKAQFCIEYEAKERGLQVAKVDPRGTSSRCPRCGAKLVEVGHRRLRCPRCGLEGDRDVIATIHIVLQVVTRSAHTGGT